MFQRDSGSLNAVMRGTVRRIPSALTVIALAVVLTACGGGGGSDEVVPVSISVQPPEPPVVAGGSTVRISVQANGTDLTFQWQRSIDVGSTWADIAGATSSVLELANVTADQDGHQFRARINGKSGSATSSAVTLHVTPVGVPPSFTVDLASPVEVSEDSNVTLSVTAGGTNLTYLWQSSTDGGTTWTDIPGNNAPTLALQAVPLTADGTQYRVKISNSAVTSVTSKVATLKVNPVVSEPVVTTQPQAQSVTASSPATFTVAGTGRPTPTVQWQVSTDNGSTWSNIPGATSLTYTIATTSTSQSGNLYRAVLTNSAGSVPSNGVALTVQVAPVPAKIVTAPANVTAAVGAQAEFKVTASGTPTPTIQWQISTDSGSTWSNINGATSATYTTPVLTTADNNKRYRAVVSNSAGSDPSAAAVLTVNAPVSVLSNKSWQTGALLENDSLAVVYDPQVGISDDGMVTAIFKKSEGPNSHILYAIDKKSVDSGWSAPITIDTNAKVDPSSQPILSISPSGHAIAVWQSPGPNYNSPRKSFAARKMAGRSWEPPILIGDLVDNGAPTAAINDNGDIAILFGSDTSAGRYPSIAMRKSSESTYRIEHLTDSGMNLGSLRYIGAHIVAGLDKSGTITVVAQRGNANGTNDIVAYRGTVSAGFGTTPVAESLESRTADASLQAVRVGLDGHVAVVWNQNNGSNNATLISVRSPATGTWEPNDLTPAFGASLSDFFMAVPDGTSGDVLAYKKCFVVKRVNGVWKDKQALPNNCGIPSIGAVDRNGNYVIWSGAQWAAYDASQNVMIKAFPTGTATAADYILGVNQDPRYSPGGGDKIAMALSPKGFGVSVVTTQYTQMPSLTGIDGDFGNIRNLWGFYFK